MDPDLEAGVLPALPSLLLLQKDGAMQGPMASPRESTRGILPGEAGCRGAALTAIKHTHPLISRSSPWTQGCQAWCSDSGGMGWEGEEGLGLRFDACLRAGLLVLRQTWEQP